MSLFISLCLNAHHSDKTVRHTEHCLQLLCSKVWQISITDAVY